MATGIRLLDNAAALLSALAARGPLATAELAAVMDIPRPSTYRLVDALEHAGMLARDADGRVGLALKLMRLGYSAAQQDALTRAADEVMTRLRDDTGLTVYLCRRNGDEIRCLDRRQGVLVGLLMLTPGGRLPTYAGAASRVIVAYDEELRAKVVADAPYDPWTDATVTDAAPLDREFALTRERGYGLSDEDVTLGVAALGVPVWSTGREPLAALSVAGLRDEVLGEQDALVARLRGAADQIRARLT